jgi:signal transduction histidine kinase
VTVAAKISGGLLVRAALSVGVAAAVGLTFWIPLRNESRAHIQEVTKIVSRTVRSDIEDDMQIRILSQILMAQLGIREGKGKDGDKDRESRARLFIAHYPGDFAVEWVDATYHVRWVITEAESTDQQSLRLATDESVRNAIREFKDRGNHDAILTAPYRLWNGKTGHHIVAPTNRDGKTIGYIVATLDDEKVLNDILSEHIGLGYSVVVLAGDQEIYRLPGSTAEYENWAQEGELRLAGTTWRVRVWPQANLLTEVTSSLPAVGLITGAVIGLLLFTTLDFGWTSRLRSKDLSRSRDHLELRVQERTAELQSTNKALEAEINERTRAEQSLRQLSGRVLQLRDEEQRRLARNLHDSAAGMLGALNIYISRARGQVLKGDTHKALDLLAQSIDLVDTVMADLRTISHLMHPPILERVGLEGALSWLTTGFSSRSGIQVKLEFQANLGRFPHEVELTLFRIVQEALTNIHRHSGSSTATIVLAREKDRVILKIRDYGRGIHDDIVQQIRNEEGLVGVGIAGMRERVKQLGGHLEISVSSGTSIRVVLPIPDVTRND